MSQKITTIFWDFDGVLMNSNAVRDKGFELVLADYPKNQVQQLMEFHQANGGLSRYVKFRYFFEEVRGEKVTDEEVQVWANKFSEIMLANLINEDLLIKETNDFVKANYQNYKMHIVSGSDGNELRKICKGVGIDKYFKTIEGSPTPKNQLVSNLLDKYQYDKEDTCLIGDSFNDYEAAINNEITFFNYNNIEIRGLGKEIISFKKFNY